METRSISVEGTARCGGARSVIARGTGKNWATWSARRASVGGRCKMPTPTPYGHAWRTRIRPEALRRAGWECARCGLPDRAMGLRSALDVAHLNGDTADMSEENLAVLD